ncbi:uncharacterized protein VTP21DRAFT_9071 [Calcarisporiella thermophila]|uniref:uncharacterized protein n=1 Tax=Calcarisporiella thermophila TaxID=911321 RepID=UPI003742B12F
MTFAHGTFILFDRGFTLDQLKVSQKISVHLLEKLRKRNEPVGLAALVPELLVDFTCNHAQICNAIYRQIRSGNNSSQDFPTVLEQITELAKRSIGSAKKCQLIAFTSISLSAEQLSLSYMNFSYVHIVTFSLTDSGECNFVLKHKAKSYFWNLSPRGSCWLLREIPLPPSGVTACVEGIIKYYKANISRIILGALETHVLTLPFFDVEYEAAFFPDTITLAGFMEGANLKMLPSTTEYRLTNDPCNSPKANHVYNLINDMLNARKNMIVLVESQRQQGIIMPFPDANCLDLILKMLPQGLEITEVGSAWPFAKRQEDIDLAISRARSYMNSIEQTDIPIIRPEYLQTCLQNLSKYCDQLPQDANLFNSTITQLENIISTYKYDSLAESIVKILESKRRNLLPTSPSFTIISQQLAHFQREAIEEPVQHQSSRLSLMDLI